MAKIDHVSLEVKENGKSYLTLEKLDAPHYSLFVTHWNEDTCAEIEVCMHK